ncbi:uncharacterized protein BT62DRAFT_938141 [Guyanagaster necrorhizus]|uniref:Uncharacterized protein n=1 Tax=Guyanagaster necrorhizus TaxID=856835 RepID=A0A9P7VG42_9AGAR|nr:uncharacterized protein BT62DRAFT_938141 [Guyanagaster necrorhizus MCA 3950]KAG7440326.1 hypothetical protein BT62DRAFT_938141 [Guyanagaster necrorhizus MCA 3950]
MYFSLAFLLSGLALVSPVLSEVCKGQVTLSEYYIGVDKNVKVETVSCPEISHAKRSDLSSRQASGATNVCGAECDTSCFTPSGGGPDPNECHVIADALRYDSENTGTYFDVNNGTAGDNIVVMTYNSCETFFANQADGVLEYCRTDWASVIDWVAPNCQSTQNAHGGDCIASDQTWFIQVQHS